MTSKEINCVLPDVPWRIGSVSGRTLRSPVNLKISNFEIYKSPCLVNLSTESGSVCVWNQEHCSEMLFFWDLLLKFPHQFQALSPFQMYTFFLHFSLPHFICSLCLLSSRMCHSGTYQNGSIPFPPPHFRYEWQLSHFQLFFFLVL